MIAALAGLAVAAIVGPDGLGRSGIFIWNWYHYYLGSKYFEELGYTDLYEQTIVAQQEDAGPLADMTWIRDLRTYRFVRVDQIEGLGRSPAFTDERWEEFKADVGVLVPQLPRKKWRAVVRDRGYNATPFYDALAGPLANAVSLESRWQTTAVKGIDVVGLAAAILLLGSVFGWWRTAVVVGAFLWFPANGGRCLGGFVQYDWFVLFVAAVALMERKDHGAAGFALGLAVCLRVFPLLFVGAWLARVIFTVLDERRVPKRYLKLGAGFALALLLGFSVGSLGQGGASRWSAFADNISTHNRIHKYGDKRVGLQHLLTLDLGTFELERSGQRRRNLEAQRPLQIGITAVVLGLLALALRRRDDLDSMILMTAAMFVLLVASRYYWSLIALWPLLGVRGLSPRWQILGCAVAFLPTLAWFVATKSMDSGYGQWLVVDATVLVLLTGALVALIVRDVRHWGGIGGWLRPCVAPEDPTTPAPG